MSILPEHFIRITDGSRQLPWFYNKAQVANIDLETAFAVVRAARRMLLLNLMHAELHEHVTDDCGDYLKAATDNWHRLFHDLHDTDVLEEEVLRRVKEFLLEPASEWLGSDGEIRFELFSDEYQEASYGSSN